MLELLVVFVCVLPFGRPFLENARLVLFVCVALRAASNLKNYVSKYLLNVFQVTKDFYLPGFEYRECLGTLSFEQCCRMHQSTSQIDAWS